MRESKFPSAISQVSLVGIRQAKNESSSTRRVWIPKTWDFAEDSR